MLLLALPLVSPIQLALIFKENEEMLKAQTQTGSTERVLRTMFQVLVAAVPAVPVLTTTLGLSTHLSAEVVGITGILVIVITAIHNGLETAGLLPAMLKTVPMPVLSPTLEAAAQALAPVVVADAQKAQAAGSVIAPVIAAAEASTSRAQVSP